MKKVINNKPAMMQMEMKIRFSRETSFKRVEVESAASLVYFTATTKADDCSVEGGLLTDSAASVLAGKGELSDDGDDGDGAGVRDGGGDIERGELEASKVEPFVARAGRGSGCFGDGGGCGGT